MSDQGMLRILAGHIADLEKPGISRGALESARARINEILEGLSPPITDWDEPQPMRVSSAQQLTSPVVRSAVWRKSGGKCWYCGMQTTPWESFEIDHFIPIKAGGMDALDNLVPACEACNRRKSDRDIEQFRIATAARLGVGFTEAQVVYWSGNGVELPASRPYLFWFERPKD